MRSPTFSVVTAAYNASATIGATIRSVLAQTRQDFELIVVDDGSTDDTGERVQAFTDDPRVRLVSQDNRGISRARNVGIENARGRYVSMLDSDDLLLPSYLEHMGKALAVDPGAGFAYTDAWVLDDVTHRIQRATAMHYQDPPERPPKDPETLLRMLLQRNFVFVSVTIPRRVIDGIGGYDLRLSAAEDYELTMRIAARGYRAVRPPGVLAVYRRRQGSVSRFELRMATNLRTVFSIVVAEYPVSDSVRDVARARIKSLDPQIAALQGSRTPRALVHALRRRLVQLKLFVVRPLLWHRTPPAEVAEAFPNLREL